MATKINVPVKTPEALAELSSRQRKLTQRQRTVLLLVDGKRSSDEVLNMAQQAGVADTCYGELIEMGMIADPRALGLARDSAPMPFQSSAPAELAGDVGASPAPLSPPGAEPQAAVSSPGDAVAAELLPVPAQMAMPVPAAELSVAVPVPVALARARAEAPDSVSSALPASLTLQPESFLNDSVLNEPASSGMAELDALAAGGSQDEVLEEARSILIRAVRAEAPVAGSLTLLRLRRARSRSELEGLLQEVELRITKPFKGLWANQTMSRVREMLSVR